MDFSNGYYQPYSKITGTATTDSVFSIETDQQLGAYLQCTSESAENHNVSWSGSMNYLNNIISGTAPFSVSFWLRAPRWDEIWQQVVLCWKYYDSDPGLVLYEDGNNTSKFDARLAEEHNFFTESNVNDNNWVHWVFVRDAQGAKWYRNGVLDASNSSYGSYDNTASKDLNIGYCNSWGCNAYYDITKIRIYKRAIDENQIESLYKAKK